MTDNDPYFTLCEAVTWIAYRDPHRIISLIHAQDVMSDFDFDTTEIQSAASTLKSRLSHPDSGILVMGINEYNNDKKFRPIPHGDFMEDIQFDLYQETIVPSSVSLDNIINEGGLPRWRDVKLLKDDIKREWPEGWYLPADLSHWPDKPFLNALEAVNAMAFCDPQGTERFDAIQEQHGIELDDWDKFAIECNAIRRLRDAAIAGKVNVSGLRKTDTAHVPIPATDWVTLVINLDVLHVDSDDELQRIGANKTEWHPDGDNYWRHLIFPLAEIYEIALAWSKRQSPAVNEHDDMTDEADSNQTTKVTRESQSAPTENDIKEYRFQKATDFFREKVSTERTAQQYTEWYVDAREEYRKTENGIGAVCDVVGKKHGRAGRDISRTLNGILGAGWLEREEIS